MGNFHSGFHRNKIFDCQVALRINYSSYIIQQIPITVLKETNIPDINENKNKICDRIKINFLKKWNTAVKNISKKEQDDPVIYFARFNFVMYWRRLKRELYAPSRRWGLWHFENASQKNLSETKKRQNLERKKHNCKILESQREI